MHNLDELLAHFPQLDSGKIKDHAFKIRYALEKGIFPMFHIHGFCTTQEQGVIALASYQHLNGHRESQNQDPHGHGWAMASIILAAGAATRHLAPMGEAGLDTQIAPMMPVIQKLLAQYKNPPKALIPTTQESDSFLKIKFLEQIFTLPCAKTIFITQPLHKKMIHDELLKFKQAYGSRSPQFEVHTQDLNLHTVRFAMDGKPFIENNGLSTVPGGHGELIYILNSIIEKNQNISHIHIRNIDNIIGLNTKENIQKIHGFFNSMKQCLDNLRVEIFNKNLNEKYISTILKEIEPFIGNKKVKRPIVIKENQTEILDRIFNTLCPIFHWPEQEIFLNLELQKKREILKNHLQKPLSVMGMVHKKEGDRGGIPVTIKKHTKICLEMTHCSPQDLHLFEQGKDFFFNPGLLFFESRFLWENNSIKTVDFNTLIDPSLWLFTKRPYKNQEVCYHELALYEILGNSEKTNLIFLEIPRCLFKPHKSILDSIGKTRKDYGIQTDLP